MKSNNSNDSFIIEKQTPLQTPQIEAVLPLELADNFKLYPENRRRPVNKVLFKNDYFQLTYSMKEHSMTISSRGDIVYSAIPYDTCRNYIQRAAIQYLVQPEGVHQYLEFHKAILEKYLILSIFQLTKKRVEKDSFEVTQAYNAIFQNPLFEIQILGRLLQHNETGPLSANLAGKFLFSENVKTGISGYVSEYLNFVVQLTNLLPLTTDGRKIQLLKTNQHQEILIDKNMYNRLTGKSDIKPALALLPQEVRKSIEDSIIIAKPPLDNKPILKSKYKKELSQVRKNYIAHSINPEELEQYFENILPIENTNLVNVISDIHILDGEMPFVNKNFNILAGDIPSSHTISNDISGIYVIGNHELVDVLPDIQNKDDEQWKKWHPFFEDEWFKTLLQNPDEAWYLLPMGNHSYYEMVKRELEKRFPKASLLNNSSIIHDEVKYIGLTIPVALTKRRREQQRFILKSLEKLLNKDYDMPTVIVSHAPLFNELSMLSPKSKAYNKNYICSEPQIIKLFKEYNIIGAVHGHHHIPASSGRYKIVEFAEKELFVVCSIYSKMNTGFELMSLINPN